jgi:hypothetical protein
MRRPTLTLRLLAVAILAAAGFGVGCGGLPPVTPADVSRAQVRWPGIQRAELDRGRQLVVGKCGGCHQPPTPDTHRASEWPGALDEMSARSHLTPPERVAIERYLTTLSGR